MNLVSNLDKIIMNEQLKKIVDHHLDFNGSYESMENMARIINATPNASVKVPATKYTIKKSILPAFEYETHIKCHRCSNFVRSSRIQNAMRTV